MILECEQCAGSGKDGVFGGEADRCLDCRGTGIGWDGAVLRVHNADGEVVDWPCRVGDCEHDGYLIVLDYPGDNHPYTISPFGDWGNESWANFWADLMHQIVPDDAVSVEVLP
jgi:hypothetical protein